MLATFFSSPRENVSRGMIMGGEIDDGIESNDFEKKKEKKNVGVEK